MVNDTREKILDVAQKYVQHRGFNAFSYADIANEIGIRNSSIHYYFAVKDDLGEELVIRYRERFKAALEQIETQTDNANTRITLYVELVNLAITHDGKICLCGMLASDFETLVPKVQIQVRRFFEENENWLAQIIRQGLESGAFHFDAEPEDLATNFFSMLEGAMLAARVFNDPQRFTAIVQFWLKSLNSQTK